ncbi:MAG: DNA polymerase III subunit delta [Deltaproteobacteria bacterium]|nr:DNA polymerase III subunit delta [Deltaproteobacteria bacterium]MBW2067932.1 DNA polymerase III subunit delta [Deltaproteobacteria bacterium]
MQRIYHNRLSAYVKSLNLLPRVFMFFGNTPYLIDESWNTFTKTLQNRVSKRRIISKRLSPGTTAFEDIIGLIRTIPMGGIARAILVDHAENLPQKQLDQLLDALKASVPSSWVGIGWHEFKLPAKVEKVAEEVGGVVVVCNAPRTNQLPNWLQSLAKQHGKRLNKDAASLLLEYIGNDLALLASELEKLVLYTADRKVIEANDVIQASSIQKVYSAFQITDALAEGNPEKALTCVESLLRSGESPLALLGILARHVRLLWQTHSILQEGKNIEDLKGYLKLPEFVINKLAQQAQNLTDETLKELHLLLFRTDVALKSTTLPPHFIFSHLILHFFRPPSH